MAHARTGRGLEGAHIVRTSVGSLAVLRGAWRRLGSVPRAARAWSATRMPDGHGATRAEGRPHVCEHGVGRSVRSLYMDHGTGVFTSCLVRVNS